VSKQFLYEVIIFTFLKGALFFSVKRELVFSNERKKFDQNSENFGLLLTEGQLKTSKIAS
jgi:hypothetical protein